MTLHCDPLEPRTPAVGLDLVPLFGIDTASEWPAVSVALARFAAVTLARRGRAE